MKAQAAIAVETVDRDARAALARMVVTLFDHWGLSSEDQLALLGLDPASRTTLTRYRRGQPLSSSRDLMERVGHLLAVHKSLRIIFPHNRELVYAWMTARNREFDNLTPVEVIARHGFAGLLMVRTYLDQERGT